MTENEIQKLREAAEAIAEIVKQHKAKGDAIQKALEPLRDVVPPQVVEKVVERWSEKPWYGPWPQPVPMCRLDGSESTPYPEPFRTYCETVSTRDAPEPDGLRAFNEAARNLFTPRVD